jgi:signal transduction histidine kinase
MIGYDIRIPLQAITGELFLMKQEIDTLPDSPRKVNVQESLRTLQEQTDYISKIISELQDFARPLNPNWGMLTCTHSYYN